MARERETLHLARNRDWSAWPLLVEVALLYGTWLALRGQITVAPALGAAAQPLTVGLYLGLALLVAALAATCLQTELTAGGLRRTGPFGGAEVVAWSEVRGVAVVRLLRRPAFLVLRGPRGLGLVALGGYAEPARVLAEVERRIGVSRA